MRAQLLSYYNYWKNKYLKSSDGGNTPGGGYYINMKGIGPGGDRSITTSEAHGYGMMIFVLLSQWDPQSQLIFDGFYNMYDKHRSSQNAYNMSWIIDEDEQGRYASATDGDMDIAYALLLAHKQWGSEGNVNYLAQAKALIRHGIKAADFSISGRPDLGDWDRDRYNTRSSDWMPSHFQSFYEVTLDPFWIDAIDTVYDLVGQIQRRYSPKTGLMPDFVVGKTPRPAPRNYLNEDTVDFSWNACRYPFRLGLDYGLNGRVEAQQALIKSLDWLIQKTQGRPSQIKAGYFLDGRAQVNYGSAAFTAPWIVAATVHPKYQEFVNEGWNQIIRMKYDYYGDTLSLLSLIYLSGHWQKP